ncbi:MAG: tetratricopeptide repeat protein [Candidatus Zixiibacteriota bacterium]
MSFEGRVITGKRAIGWALALILAGGGAAAGATAEGAADASAEAADANLIIGEAAFLAGDLVSAEIAFYEVLLTRPDDRRAHYYLGRVYQERGLPGRAAGHYEAAAGPDFPETYFFLGRVYHEEERYDDAATAYSTYLEFYDDDAAAWFNLGVTYDAAGRSEDAEEAYLRALTEDPRRLAAVHNLAVLYHRRGDYDRAAFFWRRLLEVAPDNVEGYYGLGLSTYYAGDFAAAAQAFNAGALRAPMQGRFFYQAGRTYFELREYELSMEFYQRAAELGYDEGDVAEGMGLTYEGWRRYDKATPLLEKAASLKGEGAGPAYAALGRIEREMRRPGRALAYFFEAAARLPDNGDIQNQIGELYLEEEMATWAAEAFEKAVALEPGNPDYNYNLAVAREFSEPGRAAGQWERYIELADGVPGEKRRVSEARERLERLTKP